MYIAIMGFDEIRTNKNVSYRCWFHIVWCTKWRRKVLTSTSEPVGAAPLVGDPGPVDTRLKEILWSVADECRAEISEIEVMADHVHMLVSVDPQYGIGKFTRMCKGRSSKLLRAEFPSLKRRLPTLWTNSYFVATVGGAPLSVVKQYIENQRNV